MKGPNCCVQMHRIGLSRKPPIKPSAESETNGAEAAAKLDLKLVDELAAPLVDAGPPPCLRVPLRAPLRVPFRVHFLAFVWVKGWVK